MFRTKLTSISFFVSVLAYSQNAIHYKRYLFEWIAILDIIEVPEDNLGLIVQEEWSPQLIVPSNLCSLRDFFSALRQCIEVCICNVMATVLKVQTTIPTIDTDILMYLPL